MSNRRCGAAPSPRRRRASSGSGRRAHGRSAFGWTSRTRRSSRSATDGSRRSRGTPASDPNTCSCWRDGNAVPDPAARAQAGRKYMGVRCVGRSRSLPVGNPTGRATVGGGGDLRGACGRLHARRTFRAAIDRLDHIAKTRLAALSHAGRAVSRNSPLAATGCCSRRIRPTGRRTISALVDAAHSRGLMVLLDIVDHFGPRGTIYRLRAQFRRGAPPDPVGAAIAYDRPAVQDFFVETRSDGLRISGSTRTRFDAVDHVRDPKSPTELLVEIAERIRALDPRRPIHLTTEDNRRRHTAARTRPGQCRPRYTAKWNDDFHNAAHVVATSSQKPITPISWPIRSRRLARALAEGFVSRARRPFPARRAESRRRICRRRPSSISCKTMTSPATAYLGERLIALTPEPRLPSLPRSCRRAFPLFLMGEEWRRTPPSCSLPGTRNRRCRPRGQAREFSRFAAFDDPDGAPRVRSERRGDVRGLPDRLGRPGARRRCAAGWISRRACWRSGAVVRVSRAPPAMPAGWSRTARADRRRLAAATGPFCGCARPRRSSPSWPRRAGRGAPHADGARLDADLRPDDVIVTLDVSESRVTSRRRPGAPSHSVPITRASKASSARLRTPTLHPCRGVGVPSADVEAATVAPKQNPAAPLRPTGSTVPHARLARRRAASGRGAATLSDPLITNQGIEDSPISPIWRRCSAPRRGLRRRGRSAPCSSRTRSIAASSRPRTAGYLDPLYVAVDRLPEFDPDDIDAEASGPHRPRSSSITAPSPP